MTATAQHHKCTTLSCNSALASAACVSWKETYGDTLTQAEEIVIPCGQCVNMDMAGVLTLTGGLNVIGKLVIETPIEIETPKVIVQGELLVNSDKIWDGTTDITFTLTGTAEQTFMPADSNAEACGGNACKVGKKPFAVAGGKLLVNGMPSGEYDTPTWLHIQDALSDSGSGATIEPIEAYPGLVDLASCPDGNFIIEDFSNPSKPTTDYHVESTLGTMFTYTDTALKVSGRNDKNQGPVIDVLDTMDCIKPGVRYQVNARVKLYNETKGPDVVEPSHCESKGYGCLDILYKWRPQGSWDHANHVYGMKKEFNWQYGETIYISETIVFSDEMLDATNVHTSFHFEGVYPGIAIELYHFEFKLAPEEAYRTSSDVCTDLAPPNGDAELDPMSPFPYQTLAWLPNLFVVQDEENLSNHYFRVIGRGNSWHNGIQWDTALGCITNNAVYGVKFDYRLHASEENTPELTDSVRVRLKIKRADNSDSWYYMAKCSPDEIGSWKTCDATFTIPSDAVREGDILNEIYFEMPPYLEYDVDNISFKKGSGPITAVTVDASVDGKWGVGAEVLITSHTQDWDDDQVRLITDVRASEEAGKVDIVFNESISPPTTMKDNSLYATEIAILSRNIKVQGADDDPDPLHGGHMIILHTPGGGQSIVGLEVTNMGQAGNLGRYPIHFHMCDDVDGSKVAKNLIRATNQRCTVVHGTDRLLVDNNVAYDTFGHCYMVEDGMERYNMFSNNLGARTKRATQIIPNLPAKNNGDESDRSAATFWITNPTNYYENNVAAGGQFSGYWFELRNRPRGTMAHMFNGPEWALRTMPLGSFKNNVAHSYDSAGIRTYPFGYAPDDVAVFENSRSYRNSDSGMFIHNSRRITLDGFHFADNSQGVDVDRIDLFSLTNSQIVGRSEDYKSKVLSQGARNVCGNWPTSYIRGVEMHTFRHDRNLQPTLQGLFQNVEFSGFNDTGCAVPAVFWADDEARYMSWDYWTSLDNVKVEGVEANQIANFCRAVAVGIMDSYINDKDNGFGEALGISSGVSTIMTYTDSYKKMQAFVEPTLCHDHVENCFSYCENTCLRTVTVRVDPALAETTKLKVCMKNDLQNRCESYDSWYNNNDWADRFRIFNPALPAGSYTAEFIDVNGDAVWPRGVNITYEVETCNGAGLQDGGVEFVEPPLGTSECESLIINGGAEDSSTDPWPWVFERNMGIEIMAGAGRKHNGNAGNAFGDMKTESHDDGLTQHLDPRCFAQNKGRQYEVRAYVKLIDGNGQHVICDPSVTRSYHCPRIMLHYGLFRRESDDFRWRRDAEIEAGITRSSHVNDDGYQLVTGIVTVDERLADASNVRLFVERRSNNLEMLVDDVSVTLVSESTCAAGEDLVSNGDFETGTSELWDDRDAEGFEVVSPGVGGSGFALKMKTGSAQQLIKPCVEAGKRYTVQAKFKMLDASGNLITCNPQTNKPRCPEMSLNAYDENMSHLAYQGGIARAMDSAINTEDNYSTLWGIFEPSDIQANADKLYLFFTYIDNNHILIDDVSFKEMGAVEKMSDGATDGASSACSELIVNGDTEFGISTFWSGSGMHNDKLSTITGYGGSGLAVRATGRDHSYKGIWYSGERYMSKETCLTPSSKWKISAQLRLFEPGTDNGAECDPSERIDTSLRCPRLRVRFYNEGDPHTPIREEVLYNYPAAWNKNVWNLFEAQVEVPGIHLNVINKISISVAEVRTNIDIAVDNLSMTPLV